MSIEKLQIPLRLDQERIEAIKTLLPEAVADDRINFDALRDLLADVIEDDDQDAEHFGLTWPGKREARRLAALPSKGTLAPVPGEGVDEENTENVFIEGENLEVLKILKKSYAGKIKMIYIDPPYNTGQDFVYKDDYSEPLESYLRRTGQADEEGKLLVSNSKADGRFHSNWLSMIYPRLKLARELLREDGVIFVSIDDREIHNLRQVMNEVFGEENFLACIIWQKRVSPDNDEQHITATHDYILTFSKNSDLEPIRGFNRTSTQDDRYENPDNDPRGPWTSSDLTRREFRARDFYKIKLPSGREVEPARGRSWSIPKDNFDKLVEDNRIWFGPNGDSMPRRKRFLSEVGNKVVPVTWWGRELSSDNQTGKKEFKTLFPELNDVFENPKPLTLLKTLLTISTDGQGLVLDFFSGTGTFAGGVLETNQVDRGSRRFICVQLSEPSETGSYRTIAEITKERIRRTIKNLNESESKKLDLDGIKQDRGFRVLKLTHSNFRRWQDQKEENIGALLLQAEQKALTPLIDGAKEADVLTEIALLEGFALSSKQAGAKEFARNKVIRITDGFNAHWLYVCLDRELWEETIDLVERLPKESVFYCFDNALSDAAKIQLAECCRVVTI